MNKKYKILIALVIAAMAGAGYWYYTNSMNQMSKDSRALAGLSETDETFLQSQAYNKIDIETKGVWDRKLSVNQVGNSGKTVTGSYWAHDVWDWFAWKLEGDTWNVMVSLDGWDCAELDNIPQEYKEFFGQNTYEPPAESLALYGRYCFDHSAR